MKSFLSSTWNVVAVALFVPWTTQAQTVTSCPMGDITMAGTEGARRVVEAWRDRYVQDACPQAVIHTEGGGYPMGAARVCGSSLVYSGVDLGGMSGPFFFSQASSDNGWRYQCKRSNRNTILLHVAKEGVSFTTSANGAAAKCIQRMGGLSLDQIRWMFSSFTVREMKHTGWNPASVPFLDSDESTRKWSELNENCTASEIVIAGPPPGTEAHDFLLRHVLKGHNEVPKEYFRSSSIQELDAFLTENDAGISFFEMHDLLTPEHVGRVVSIFPVPIMDNSGTFVPPNARSFETGEYPLLRDVYLGVNADPLSLESTRPFLEYGLSQEGSLVLKQAGFWPIPEWAKLGMLSRLGSSEGIDLSLLSKSCGPANGQISAAGSSTVEPVSSIWAGLYSLGCDVNIQVEGGGSGTGAERVCQSGKTDTAVDIGNMSREFEESEAREREIDFIHDCTQGDKSRSTIEIDVALDGLSIVLPTNGVGHACVQTIGGLTFDQLRWIFSSYDELALTETGWDPQSLSNSDGNPATHLWSELDVRCAAEEIRLTGDPTGDGAFVEFSNYILADMEHGETIAHDRPLEYFGSSGYRLLREVLTNEAAITFIGYYYYFEKRDLFWAVPIRSSDGSFLPPNEETIGTGTYPMIRKLSMHLLNDELSLRHTIPFIKFGFENPTSIVSSGYVPLQGAMLDEMMHRLDNAPYTGEAVTAKEDPDKGVFGFSFVPSWLGWALLGLLCAASLIVMTCIYLHNPCARW